MSKPKGEPMERITIYLPVDVFAAVRQQAKDNDRSINKELTRIVRNSIEEKSTSINSALGGK